MIASLEDDRYSVHWRWSGRRTTTYPIDQSLPCDFLVTKTLFVNRSKYLIFYRMIRIHKPGIRGSRISIPFLNSGSESIEWNNSWIRRYYGLLDARFDSSFQFSPHFRSIFYWSRKFTKHFVMGVDINCFHGREQFFMERRHHLLKVHKEKCNYEV